MFFTDSTARELSIDRIEESITLGGCPFVGAGPDAVRAHHGEKALWSAHMC